VLACCAQVAAADIWDLFSMLRGQGAAAVGLAPQSGNTSVQGAQLQEMVAGGSSSQSGNAPFHRFCGFATYPNGQNGFNTAGLADIAAEAGARKVWHYNWDEAPKVALPGTSFVPMIKYPRESVAGLPHANSPGVGHIVKGWNEPDDRGQAGRDDGLRRNPEAWAAAWVSDMRAARAKGYTQYVAPAIAHDTVWLDFFLKGCERTPDCKSYVTYLSCHRYHNDCGAYRADPSYPGWRDDLSYLVTLYRIMKKYNARGFNIKGLVVDELGCLGADWVTPTPEAEEIQYMKEFYRGTIVAVKTGDVGVMNKIRGTPWIMPKGPDAHSPGVMYSEGLSVALPGGPHAGDDAVAAIQSLVSVAWFSQQPGENYLLHSHTDQLSSLGRTYLDSCRLVADHWAHRRLQEEEEDRRSVVNSGTLFA